MTATAVPAHAPAARLVDNLRQLTAMTDGLAGRTARASVFTFATVALALAAHLLGGGVLPQARAVLIASVVSWGLAFALSGRERGGRLLGAVVILTQLALHALFALTPRAGGAAAGGALAGRGTAPAVLADLLFCHHGPSRLTAAQLTSAASVLGVAPGQPTTSGTSGSVPDTVSGIGSTLAAAVQSWHLLGMLAAHLAAAVVMAWWLRRGERAAWAAGRRVLRVIARHLTLLLDPPQPRWYEQLGPVPVDRPGLCGRIWVDSAEERGPPSAA